MGSYRISGRPAAQCGRRRLVLCVKATYDYRDIDLRTFQVIRLASAGHLKLLAPAGRVAGYFRMRQDNQLLNNANRSAARGAFR